ncbi:MAG: sigma-70 family RNA polymerase sigma factor, partial [Candidatus Coatesbacteria bacterium]|nr:sigma-70 family RNA polymerase sigma factor [Candidatus Coatesbacteria bacterium]
LEGKRLGRRRVELEDVHTDPQPGPDRLTESRLELMRIQQVLQSLPEIDRSAFIMRIQHELPYEEIARSLGLSVSAAKVKVHRVRRRLLADRIGREDL